MAISIGDAVLMIGGDTSKLDKSLKGISQKMSQVGKNLTLKLTAPLVAFGALSLKAAIDFEDAFAGVRKTVEATEEEFAVLRQGLRDMTKELPITHGELAKIAEAAGQLGIQKEGILEFTRVMAGLGIATNMTGDEAATTLARFANITGMDTAFFEELGSTIVDLGNNTAATESEIASMALRLAAAGTVIGLTQADILGLAASLVDLGIRAEAGGTAFSRIMLEMNAAVARGGAEITLWAQAAGVSVGNFKDLFETDAIGAVMTFIGGLGHLQDSGVELTGVLDGLGLSGIRITDALLRTAGASDSLLESQERANTAWRENIALANEVAERTKTTASKLAILKNRLIDAGITIGEVLVPKLQLLIDWLVPVIENVQDWIELNPELTDTLVKVAGALALLGPALWMLGGIAGGLRAVASGIVAVKGALIGVGAASVATTAVLKIMIGASVGIGIAIAAVALIIVALVAGLAMVFLGINKILSQRRAQAEYKKEMIKFTHLLTIAEATYARKLDLVRIAQEEYQKALQGLDNELAQSLINLRDVGIELDEQQEAYIELSEAAEKAGLSIEDFAAEQNAATEIMLKSKIAADSLLASEEARVEALRELGEALRGVANASELYFGPGGLREQLIDLGRIAVIAQPGFTGGEVQQYAHGGPILGPTALTSLRTGQTYAIAGEAGPEVVGPGGFKTANIYVMMDGRTVAKVLGQHLVDDIRLKTGLQY